MSDRIHITGRPPTAAHALRAWQEIFPAPGTYVIAKADAAGPELGEFETWFLRRLYDVTRERFVTSQYAIWEVLDELLRRRGVHAPSRLDWWELNRTLFDLNTASTARMVGLRIPPDVRERLAAIGFSPKEALDFPGLAYRMGAIYQRLEERDPVEWRELVDLAQSHPLSPAEEAAVEWARTRAGLNLQPIFDDTGRVWTAERELVPLRGITARAVERRVGAREAARELSQSQRARDIFRDGDRVMRTEIADARGQGAWRARAYPDDARIFRITSRDACKACLRLYLMPDGMPRLYTVTEVAAFDAQGYNRGPQATWVPKIGATHPNCACSPWQRWLAAMESIYRRSAPAMAEMLERLKVFKEAA